MFIIAGEVDYCAVCKVQLPVGELCGVEVAGECDLYCERCGGVILQGHGKDVDRERV
jgi:Zn-finger nucleic acid-binding protein